jgi:hypothetical protein
LAWSQAFKMMDVMQRSVRQTTIMAVDVKNGDLVR